MLGFSRHLALGLAWGRHTAASPLTKHRCSPLCSRHFSRARGGCGGWENTHPGLQQLTAQPGAPEPTTQFTPNSGCHGNRAQDARWPTAPSLAAERQLSGGAGYQSFSPLKRKKLDFLRDLRGQSNQSKGWGVRRQLGRRPATQGCVCSDLSQGPTSQQGDSGQTFIG